MLHAGVLKKFRTLRFAARRPAAPAGRREALGKPAAGPAAREHHLRRPRHHRAEASRLDARLLERHAHGLHFPGHRHVQHHRPQRRGAADVRARPVDRRALRHLRADSRADRHPLFRRPGRTGGHSAVPQPCFRHCGVRLDRAARLRQFRRRDHDFLRRVQGADFPDVQLPRRHRPRPLGRGDFGGLHAARLPRRLHGRNGPALERCRRSRAPVALALGDAACRSARCRILPPVFPQSHRAA